MANMFLRTVVLYLLIVFFMRLTGKRQIGQLELTELVSAFMISELASYPISDNSTPLIYGIIPVVTIVCIEVLVSFLSIKSKRFGKLLAGNPLALIKQGEIDISQMNNARITLEELLSAIRSNGLSGINDVDYAVLEPGGTISVIAKASSCPPDAQSLNVKVNNVGIEHPLISDGVVNDREIKAICKSMLWLEQQIKNAGYSSPGDIFYLSVNDAGQINILGKDTVGK